MCVAVFARHSLYVKLSQFLLLTVDGFCTNIHITVIAVDNNAWSFCLRVIVILFLFICRLHL
jgi:hypothetical protein